MRIGLLKLTDAAPVIMAKELGLFVAEGLEVDLSIEPSGANIADKLAHGFLDAAVIAPPLAFAVTLGLRGLTCPILIPQSLSLGGNTVTLGTSLARRVATHLALGKWTSLVKARAFAAALKDGEVLLLERLEDDVWEGLARPTRRLQPGRRYGPVELLEHLGEGRWRLRLEGTPDGQTPLPPYITEPLADPDRYQTVYARDAGSAAAPTAGLHFTPELIALLDVERVTLHVGLHTFRPVGEQRLEEHRIHGERYEVAPAAWERIRSAARVLAVGTTTVRVLETLARGGPVAGRTELFVTPGFEFRRVDALLTNFHLPRSTLLALVMAFAGIEETRRLYRLAVDERYRFYSFGDAMLVL